jgi:hypothetical protein
MFTNIFIDVCALKRNFHVQSFTGDKDISQFVSSSPGNVAAF